MLINHSLLIEGTGLSLCCDGSRWLETDICSSCKEHAEFDDEQEVEVELNIHYSPFRKGDSISAWHGPTPDDEEEVILEEIIIDGKTLPDDHEYYSLISEEELFQMVQDYHESIAEGSYQGEI